MDVLSGGLNQGNLIVTTASHSTNCKIAALVDHCGALRLQTIMAHRSLPHTRIAAWQLQVFRPQLPTSRAHSCPTAWLPLPEAARAMAWQDMACYG